MAVVVSFLLVLGAEATLDLMLDHENVVTDSECTNVNVYINLRRSDVKRYKHNLSYYNLCTMDMGKLVPVGLTEVLPGDTIQHHANVVVRVSPLAAPVMHPVTVRVHHFFIPHRLTMDDWEDFITGGPDGNNAAKIPTTIVSPSLWDNNPIYDYLGIPRPADSEEEVSYLPIRAYNLVYNEYYRDQDLVSEVGRGNLAIQNIAWEKDYFTTARPFQQKGPDVTLPLGTLAPIRSVASIDGTEANVSFRNGGFAYFGNSGDPNDRLWADLQESGSVNISDFRRAFALQRYQEARARYGSRYTEYLRYLGVRPLDERLQRPEFLGGGSAQIQFSEVLQTAPEPSVDPVKDFGVGDMYGHGISAMRSNKYRRTMEEHGYVLSLMSVRPKAIYVNGIDRTFLREDKEDFFQKELQHIGQQSMQNREVYFGGANSKDTFGYTDRYYEYRQGFNRVTGEFRNLLNYWHMGRVFDEQPALNKDFVECVPTKRIHNEQTRHALWCMVQHKIGARRIVNRSAAPRLY